MTDEQFRRLMEVLEKRGTFQPQPFTVGLEAVLIRPQEGRRYFFIVNTHATARIVLGFGYAPTLTNGVPLFPNAGFYEPPIVPENDLFAVSDTVGATGVLIIVT